MLCANYRTTAVVFFSTFLFGALSPIVVNAQTAPPVPPAYQDLYNTMQSSINSFNQGTLARWDGSKYPVTFSSHISTLNSNRGATILTLNAYRAFLMQLNGLKALGVTGVVLNVDYPILDRNFDPWGGQSAAYLELYRQAIADIRTRGLKVIIETGGLFSQTVFAGVNVAPYYQSLSTTDYMTGRAQQALVIAQQLQPDYLNVLAEPDTESAQTGKRELYTYTGSMQLLNTILGVLRGAHATIPIGAGVGTWLATDSQGKGFSDYVSGYASTSVDSIDMHVYPVNRDYLTRMNTIASIAKAAGKKITMTEAWDYKVRDSELGVASMDVIYARDPYSFWAPLDTQFLQAMVDFSHAQHLDVMAAFWSDYFWSYLTYDGTVSSLAPSGTYSQVQTLQAQQMLIGSFTSTGQAWETAILATPDTTPPSAPVVTATGIYPKQVVISWQRPSDNVGVSSFTVMRSGTFLGTTVNNAYSDTGLSDGKSYTYTVTAYDARNNKTASPALTVTTPDITPPTAATTLTAALASSNSIKLTWSGAKDNVMVTGFKVYRGANGATPTGWASLGAVTDYTNSTLQSNTTYCYYVLAQDAKGLVSPASPTACAATADTLPPSMPSGVTATGTTPPTIGLTWKASTDGVGVVGYNIQRSVNGGAYSRLVSGVKTTAYTDTTAAQLPDTAAPTSSVAAPLAGSINKGTVTFSARVSDFGTSTSYLYQVNAYDAAGNTSPWVSAGRATWPANTSGIAGVRFLVDGVDAVPEVTVSPYDVRWNTASVANGSHALTVIVRDKSGNKTTSAQVVVTVRN